MILLVRSRWLLVTLTGLSLGLINAGCLRRADKERPTPPTAPEQQMAGEAVAAYAHGLADSFEEVARQLDAGTLKSAADANSRLKASNATAREKAFAPLNELLNENLGGDKWDSRRAQELFRNIAQGLRNCP
jgi:hypothetical protein